MALTGPNGSGKTTLLNLIRGHLPPDLPVLVMEQEVGDDKADEWLRTFRDLPGDGRTAVLNDYSQMNADPDTLLADGSPSPGEMRKLILALGLHQGPLLMLLDEPTNYLDHRSQEALARVLADCRGPGHRLPRPPVPK